MDRDDPAYFRPVLAWAGVAFVVGLVVTYVQTQRVVMSLFAAFSAGAVGALFMYSALTIGEGPLRRRRQVDKSRLQ